MTVSIRDFPQYVNADAFSLAQPLQPEELILDRYTFLPYVRSGIAATLSDPFDWSLPSRAEIAVSVPVVADIGSKSAGVTLTVRGPGDVLGIDRAQVIRTFPQDGKTNAESENLVHIEFDRPDLPWLFTPTGPDAQGRLVPWISLVVVVRKPDSLTVGAPGTLPVLSAPLGELQSLDDAWAWAHAQVMGPAPAGNDDAARQSITNRLADANASLNLSRVMCPRRLDPENIYLACVVPTFEAGRQAGLGLRITANTLEPAWKAGGDPESRIALPVYFSFSFTTGPLGDFEALARRLHGVPAPPGVGRRRMDTSNPGNGIPALGVTDSGREQIVQAPLRSPNDPPEETPPDNWPSEAHQQWPDATTAILTEQLNSPDENLGSTTAPGEEPTVAPPLYANKHIVQPRIDGTEPVWFHTLNLDPRNRVVANLGTRVIQMDQEALMASAWNQVAGIDGANRQIRVAQFARYAASSIYRRHLQALPTSLQFAVTSRIHKRLLAAPGETVFARVSSSALPTAVVSGAFRRLTRPRGPVARFAARSLSNPTTLYNRLVSENELVTRDYVRPYAQPDGVVSISPLAKSMVSDVILTHVFGGSAVAARQSFALQAAALGKASIPDMLSAATELSLAGSGWLSGKLAVQVLPSVLSGIPDVATLGADRQQAIFAAGRAKMLRTFLNATSSQSARWPVDPSTAKALGLTTTTEKKQTFTSSEQLLQLATAIESVTRGMHIERELTVEQSSITKLDSILRAAPFVEGETVASVLLAMGERFVSQGGVSDIARNDVRIPDLNLVPRLDPAVTVTARVRGRLGISPAWLRADWFLDLHVEPVMAAPTFPFAMCEALNRLDQEWMIPGVGQMQPPELVTLLSTNENFVEAFLIGLNHEMARELLWRGYPTDQRGTYFNSFWTGANELTHPIHLFDNVPLGQHIVATFHNRIVLLVRGELVRRYPGVVARATQQAGMTADNVPVFETGNGAKSIFHIHLPPDILLVGFDILPDDVRAPGPAWWFTLSENPTEPRFGFDDGQAGNGTHERNDLTWADFGIADDPASRTSDFLTTSTPPLTVDGLVWGHDAAIVAHFLFQLPARAAFKGTRMLDQVKV